MRERREKESNIKKERRERVKEKDIVYNSYNLIVRF